MGFSKKPFLSEVYRTEKLTQISRLSKWQQWTGIAAAVWSFLYGLMGYYWAMGELGFHSVKMILEAL